MNLWNNSSHNTGYETYQIGLKDCHLLGLIVMFSLSLKDYYVFLIVRFSELSKIEYFLYEGL